MLKVIAVSIVLSIIAMMILSLPYLNVDINMIKEIGLKVLGMITVLSIINFFIIRGM